MNLKAQGGINQQVALILTELMTTEISKIDTFEVINRDDMQTMLAHIADKQLLGCDDTKCLVKIGGALGVEYLVSGNLGKVGDRFVINLKLINIDNADVKNRITDKNAKTEGQLLSNIEKSVYDLFGSSRHSVYAEQDGGDIFVSTDRPNTEVYVDGVLMEGTAPLTLENIAAGMRVVEARSGDFYAKRIVDLAPNGLVKVNLTLSIKQGFLKVFSNPPGAAVIVGGKNRGTTPVMVENIASGRQHVTLRHGDYLDYTFTADVKQGEVEKVNVDLVPAGFLAVSVNPAQARASVNGVAVDFNRIPEVKVPAGSVTVVVAAEHYDTAAQTFYVPFKQHRAFKADLKYKYAVLDIRTVPDSAEVYLGKVKKGYTPYYDKFVVPGDYVLRVAKPSYEAVMNNLTLEKHTRERLSFTLEHTRAYLDSVKRAKTVFKRKRQKIQKIVCGAASVVLAGVAAYHEFGARSDLDEQESIYDEYEAGTYGADFTGYKRDYDAAGDRIDDHISGRNLFSVLSGISAGLVGLAFVF